VLWGPLLEKAWAKVKGNYGQADGGYTGNGIRALTGAPVYEYFTEDLVNREPDEIWETFRVADDLDYILTAGTFGSDDSLNSCGIANGHAFSLISVFNFKDVDQYMRDFSLTAIPEHKLYLLRNPWGVTNHTGEWDQTDPRLIASDNEG
jgi:hypothetical protein